MNAASQGRLISSGARHKTIFCLILTVATLTAMLPIQARAQTGPITALGLNTHVSPPSTLPSGQVQYTITGGTRPGGGTNLFHSFGEFGVPANNIANFLNETALPTSNILGRVTGGNISNIYGTIQTTGFGNANLFLLNPAGFLFGPGATVNVRGMVAFTSADYLRFQGTDTLFNNASTPDTLAPLALPSVSAFGFLGSNPGAITVQGSQLTVTEGTGITLVGGNITITADPESGTLAMISAPSGRINLASVLSAGDLSLTTLEMTPASVGTTASLGSISIIQQSLLDAGGSPGGTIRIRGGQFTLDRSTIAVPHTGDGTAGEINIAADSVDLIGGAQIVSTNSGTSSGPVITVSANHYISIAGFDQEGTLTGIVPSGFGPVPSGIISTTSSSGAGGKISITRQGSSLTPRVTLAEGGAIASMTSGSGAGGDLLLTDITSLDLKTGGQITTTSGMFDFETGEILGSGPGGHITIQANESVTVNGGQLDLFQQSAIFSSTNTIGKGGDISISAPTVAVGNSGAVVTSSGSGGSGGAITISDFTQLTVSGFTPEFLNSTIVSAASSEGTGGHITLSSSGGTVRVDQLGVVRSQNTGNTAGGDIALRTRDVMVTNGGAIEATATSSTGSSGKITLTAENDVRIVGQVQDPVNPEAFARSHVSNNLSGIDSQSGTNNGIAITATHDIEISGGGRVESITGVGNGGDVSLSADHSLTLSEPLTIGLSTLDGAVGSLTLSAPIITLQARAVISSSSASNADAGEIRLAGDVIVLKDGSSIHSDTQQGTGRGGTIVIDAEDSVFLSGGSSIQSNTTTSQGGNAGSITITAAGNFESTGASISTSSTGPGNAGNIAIAAGQAFRMTGSTVRAEAAQAGGGNIDIRATDLIRLADSSISTSVLGGSGGGGNIFIDPNVVILRNSQILAQAVQGNGGAITINYFQLYLADALSLVDASSQFGLDGPVNIQSPTSSLSGTVSSLPASLRQTQALQTGRCTALADSQVSSLIIAGRDQLPAEPAGWSPSPFATGGDNGGPFAQTVPSREPVTMPADGSVSLRRMNPAGFLTQSFAENGLTGCRA